VTVQPLTDEQLAAIQTRADAATPGPWWADSHEIYAGPDGIPALGEWVAETCVAGELERSEANGRFVGAAREDVPALLAEVHRLRAEQGAAGEQIRRITSQAVAEEDRLRAERDAARAQLEQLRAEVRAQGDALLRQREQHTATGARGKPFVIVESGLRFLVNLDRGLARVKRTRHIGYELFAQLIRNRITACLVHDRSDVHEGEGPD